MDNIKIALIISVSLLIIACCYIITTKVDLCETAKNESYSGGFEQGVEYWNTIVIYQTSNNNVIPYWFNDSYYELNIAQICGGQNG